jgi:hypothetical protein
MSRVLRDRSKIKKPVIYEPSENDLLDNQSVDSNWDTVTLGESDSDNESDEKNEYVYDDFLVKDHVSVVSEYESEPEYINSDSE